MKIDKGIRWRGYIATVNAFKEANHIQNNTKETEGIVGATTWVLIGLDYLMSGVIKERL